MAAILNSQMVQAFFVLKQHKRHYFYNATQIASSMREDIKDILLFLISSSLLSVLFICFYKQLIWTVFQ